jgi:hypothetical protein
MQIVDQHDEDTAGSGVGALARREYQTLNGGGRWWRRQRAQIRDTSAIHDHHRHNGLSNVVFEDLKVLLFEIGHELAIAGARDDIEGDEVDGGFEGGLCLRGWPRSG